MPELKPEQLLLFAGFVLPGAISMYVYGLKVPQKEYRLQERLLEAVCFSLLNFLVVWWPVSLVVGTSGSGIQRAVYLVAFTCLPVVWPVLLVWCLRFAERQQWIAVRARTAWDDFFDRHRGGIWVRIELNDGRTVGGKFSAGSYASAYPDPGHLYIEELWVVDAQGAFVSPEPGNPGLLLRPSDYKLVTVFTENAR